MSDALSKLYDAFVRTDKIVPAPTVESVAKHDRRAEDTKDEGPSARDLIKAALASPLPLPGPTFNPFTKAQEPPPNMFMTKKD